VAQASVNSGDLSRSAARQLRSSPDADIIVCGSYVTIGRESERQVRLDSRLQIATWPHAFKTRAF
jgi:hypothetical protein